MLEFISTFKLITSKLLWVLFLTSSMFIAAKYGNYNIDVVSSVLAKYGSEIYFIWFLTLSYLIIELIGWLWSKWIEKDLQLKIIKATYGASTTPKDVTQTLKKNVKNDYLEVTVDDDLFLAHGKSDDDMPGSPKKLIVEYQLIVSKEQGEILRIGSKND